METTIQADETLAVFPRCNGQVIVRFDQYDGEDFLDLRKWVFSDQGLKPTRLGTKFKLDELKKLAETVNAAIGQVDYEDESESSPGAGERLARTRRGVLGGGG